MSSRQAIEQGLYRKYEVHEDGQPVEGCFVLRPDRDPAARVALLAYAAATDDLRLASDLRRWVDEIQVALAPDHMKAIGLALSEGLVADAARKAELARRGAEEADFMLEHAQQALARVKQEGR